MVEGRVLLVDDEEEFVKLLAERMRTRGLTVRTAFSGAAALEWPRRRPLMLGFSTW